MSLEEIARVNRKFEELVSIGNRDGLAELYSEDALVMPPDAEVARGRDAIRKLWDVVLDDMGVKSVQLDTKDLQIAGDGETAYEVGEATLKMEKDGAPATAVAKYVVVWIRIDGAWRLHRDIWNNNP